MKYLATHAWIWPDVAGAILTIVSVIRGVAWCCSSLMITALHQACTGFTCYLPPALQIVLLLWALKLLPEYKP